MKLKARKRKALQVKIRAKKDRSLNWCVTLQIQNYPLSYSLFWI